MRTRAKTAIAAVGITALAVVGLDTYTYAGTGDSLILGKLNKSSKTTHVKSTGKGPALSLHAKGKRPALAVDSKAKIVRLNADRVDGRHAAALQNNVRVYTARTGSSTNGAMEFKLPNVPKGRYQVSYSVFMDGATGSVSNPTLAACYLYTLQAGDWQNSAYTSTIAEGMPAGLSGYDVITKAASPLALYCTTNQHGVGADDWNIPEWHPVRVTLTRVDRTIGRPLDITRSSARTPAGPAR
jgi:hypothetical protein